MRRVVGAAQFWRQFPVEAVHAERLIRVVQVWGGRAGGLENNVLFRANGGGCSCGGGGCLGGGSLGWGRGVESALAAHAHYQRHVLYCQQP